MAFRSDMIMILEIKAACDTRISESKAVNDKAFSESRFVNMSIPNFLNRPEIGVSALMDPILIDMRKQIHDSFEKVSRCELVPICARFPVSLIEIERKYPDEVLKPYFK